MSKSNYLSARERMLARIAQTRETAKTGLPHWARTTDGKWTFTPDGDWTGGAFVGQLWLAHLADPQRFPISDARAALSRMLPRAQVRTAFKGFGFYHGAALGSILFADDMARDAALTAARSLEQMFDPKLGLIPLGQDAEEANAVGTAESSIDSLQATGLLYWASDQFGERRMDEIANAHMRRVLEIHVRPDNSVIQSSTLDPQTGKVLRTHTHKGYSDLSTWGRAQGWAILYTAHAAMVRPKEPLWREYAVRLLDWWIDHVPSDLVAYWDFDDPAIPDTSRDTAATAIAAAASLRLASALGPSAGAKYRDFAERTVAELISAYLTPIVPSDKRPPGMLTGGCFTRKALARDIDTAHDAELIFGSYFLFEALAILTGLVTMGRI
ncbi:unsaturated chondroitin disaccharide hydrolase [Bradyrhizobium elkanii]|uniref:glycoside hydrolase family 88 protein n=1 Tax=Bradyrhizobium TaxID=374 RepID=UPI00216A341E|nr:MULTISPECIES: glycoside hydrolase family 88 protein [Bradyrhizobium]MCS3926179.1 unsaturated chondroitin disaccharide hydrolase [Bradyrhizobium elkanii]MCS3966731.1 unsaturated chondroitin disaccharide hydrolase [Bradyrhizobium japonicum]